jgi:hypothetical protein
MRILLLTLLAFSCMIGPGCETTDELNPISSNTSKPVFFLLFEVNNDNGVRTVDVEFCTNSMTVIPAVTVSGDTLKTTIDFQDGIIRSELRGLQYKNVYNYKISANRHKTAGEITMPACPKNVKCNGTLLNETQLNLLSDSDSLRFSWDCYSYDYFCYNWEGNSNIEATTNDTHLSFTIDGSHYYKLNFVSVAGPCLKPGTRPNVTGDCGDGFVLGLSEELEYDIWIGGARIMKRYQNNPCKYASSRILADH